MYTTRIKRFVRKLNFIKRYDVNEFKTLSYNNKLLLLIKSNNKIKIFIELKEYINTLSYNKNKFNEKEKNLIKNTIKDTLFRHNKINHNIKEISNKMTVISLSGFGYSGTGAIHDYLRDTKSCVDVLEGRELDLYKYQFSLYDIYKKSIENNKISEKDIQKFIFSHVFGLPFPGGVTRDEIDNRLVGSKSLLKAILRLNEDSDRLNLVKDICLFINQIYNLKYIKNTKTNLELISRNLINNIGKYYKSKYPVKRYIILNNWIPASNINLSNLLPVNTRIIVTTRDGLDAYYSWWTECPRIIYKFKLLIFPYLFLYFLRHLDFSKNFKLLDLKMIKNISYIYFEDFIERNLSDEGFLYYKNLFKLEYSDKVSNLNFDPMKSKNNINIYYRNTKLNLFSYLCLKLNQVLNSYLKTIGCFTYKRKEF